MRLKSWRDRSGQLARQVPIVTRGRQGRFLLAILFSWSCTRAYLLWPQIAPKGSPAFIAPPDLYILGGLNPIAAGSPPFEADPTTPNLKQRTLDRRTDWSTGANAAHRLPQATGDEAAPASHMIRRVTLTYTPATQDAKAEEEAPMPSPAPFYPHTMPKHRSTIETQAYVFWRPGKGPSSLAERGELGGSQVAARIAVPLGHGLMAAGRVYAPLEHPGAEAAIGLDWHPLPGTPLRISVERRQRLDALGRSAWSAYAAGGFWRGGGPGRAVFDGYAQAGIVGTQRRDLFIDGALRLGYQLPMPGPTVTIGGGLWGAAQPQVSRLDIGPRVAAVLPVEGHNITFALDGRFRMAGRAAPGSGAALTIAADF